MSDSSGAKPITKHKAEKSNIERAEDDENRLRGFQKFPMYVYGAGGLSKLIGTEDALAEAVGGGWYDDIRKVPQDFPELDPENLSQMTIEQAKKKIAGASIWELGALEAEEISHGNRADVIALIDAAKDAAVSGKRKGKRG